MTGDMTKSARTAQEALLLAAVFSGNVLSALLYCLLPPILVPIAARFGGGDEGMIVAQLAVSMPLFGVMAGGALGGAIIAAVGLRASFLISLSLFAVAGTVGGVLDAAWALLATRAAFGFAGGLLVTGCTSLLALGFPQDRVARMNGWLIAVGSVSSVFCGLLAGWVATIDWRAPFLLHALLALPFIPPVLALRDWPRVADSGQSRSGEGYAGLLPVLPAYLSGFSYFVIGMLFNAQFVFLLSDIGVTSPVAVSLIIAANAVIIALVSPASGWLARVMAAPAIVALGFGLAAAAAMTAALGYNVWILTAAICLSGAATGIGLPAIWTWAMQKAPSGIVPYAMGLMSTATCLGGAVSPLVLAPLRARFGIHGLYGAVAILMVAVLVLIGCWRFRPGQRPLAVTGSE
jgi:MFS family permease